MNAPHEIQHSEIQLSTEQTEALARLSLETGKPWSELLGQALDSLKRQALSSRSQGSNDHAETVHDAMTRAGLLGCLKGPPDLSTNSAYMEGFGSHGQ